MSRWISLVGIYQIDVVRLTANESARLEGVDLREGVVHGVCAHEFFENAGPAET